MKPIHIYRSIRNAVLFLACGLLTGNSFGEPYTGPILGTWAVVSVNNVRPDGSKLQAFGANPKGLFIFDATGHFAEVLMSAARPKFASNSRIKGTPEEYKATVLGTRANFGTYSVNETDKSLVQHIEGDTFSNQEGMTIKRIFVISNDQMELTNPTAAVGGTSVSVWRRVR